MRLVLSICFIIILLPALKCPLPSDSTQILGGRSDLCSSLQFSIMLGMLTVVMSTNYKGPYYAVSSSLNLHKLYLTNYV